MSHNLGSCHTIHDSWLEIEQTWGETSLHFLLPVSQSHMTGKGVPLIPQPQAMPTLSAWHGQMLELQPIFLSSGREQLWDHLVTLRIRPGQAFRKYMSFSQVAHVYPDWHRQIEDSTQPSQWGCLYVPVGTAWLVFLCWDYHSGASGNRQFGSTDWFLSL